MKIFYTLISLMISGMSVFGQCIPDTSITHNQPGTYPDTLTGLPHSIVGQAYSTVIQIKVLTDSTVGGIQGTVDSIVLNGVTGLPAGFSFVCFPTNCNFPGGSDACITLQGSAPTSPMMGTYPLVVNTIIYYKAFGVPGQLANDISGYSIVIEDSTTGISSVEKFNFGSGQNIPNPAKNFTTVPVTMSHGGEVSLTISNVIGKKVFNHSYNLQKGKSNIQIDLHGLQPGIYLYTFSNGINTVTKRMIVSND